MSDIGEGAAVDKGWGSVNGLDQIRFEGILEQEG